jgi:glycosyltransferase involved in cell wall biosynthesis
MNQTHPFFSVIIPTRDRPEQLFGCLQSLERQNYPSDRFEVIVVDDGGTIPLETVVERFNDSIDMKLFKQKHVGPAKARNTGAGYAKGQFLAFTDDDCNPANDWLETLAILFSSSADCVIGGSTINTLTTNPFSCASQLINDFSRHYHNNNEAGFLTSNNFAVPADRFRAIGGFDTSFTFAGGEDREFFDRWSHHGYAMLYIPKLQVCHGHHLTLFSFLRQQFNYGRGSLLFHKLMAKRNRRPLHLQPMAFYLKLLSYPLLQTRGFRMATLTILTSLSQIAVALGFLFELIKTNSDTKAN